MGFKPLGEPRTEGPGVIHYLRDASHGHEGGHRIAVAGREVRSLPDGRTTASNRSHVITRVLHSLGDSDTLAVEALVGALVLEGATNLEVDGQAILAAAGETVATIRIDVVDDGTLRVTSIGGAG